MTEKKFGLVYDLEGKFGCHVDLVSIGIRDKKFLTEITEDEVSNLNPK